MWIRSQDKTRMIYATDIDYDYDERDVREKTGKLIKVRGFKIPEYKVVGTEEEHWILANGVRVALYSTKEKALRVLSNIYRHIMFCKLICDMPKDSEVQVNVED